MSLSHLILLSGIQGLTEFLPVSSSGHLIIFGKILEVDGQSLILDVAMHIGTLGAVMIYLWRDIIFMINGVFISLLGKPSPGGKLFLMLLVATIPVCLFGYALNHYYPAGIINLKIIGWMTVVFGVGLIVADRIGMTVRRIEHLNYSDGVLIGIAQVLALIPGTSRSGICITVARVLGMERTSAARFAMLLGIPTILGAGTLKAFELFKLGDIGLTRDFTVAIGLSFIFALFSITLMMAWLRRASLMPFGIYRVLFGSGLLLFLSTLGN